MIAAALDALRYIGSTSIEVYEWDEADVRLERLKNGATFGALTTRKPNLVFHGLELAHAVVKADYLDRRNLVMPGLGFLLQAQNIVDIWSSSITLRAGASKAMNDVSQTSLAARVGQGLTILYGQSMGMKFAAHLRSHVTSMSAGVASREAMADFLFTDEHRSALFESKASFTLEDNDPKKIRRVLKNALENQIDPWMMRLTPAPNEGYVAYSCLRERSWLPSAMFVVDPPGDSNSQPDVPLTSDQVLRENYGAWFRAMGLYGVAARLVRSPLEGEHDVMEVPFLLQEVLGRTYAFFDYPSLPYTRWTWPQPLVGLDVEVVRAISAAAQSTGQEQELNISLESVKPPEKLDEPFERVSIFPDGSLFGLLYSEPLGVEWHAL